jgi:putative ABC transport system permease protein
MIFHLALRELRFSGPKLRLVILILFLGFLGPLFSSALKSSVADYLKERSRGLLAADLAVSSTKPFEEKAKAEILKALDPVRSVEQTEFVTMARGRDVATLVEVNGVEGAFPIYGAYKVEGGGELKNSEPLQNEKIAWVFPEVLAQLGLKNGESIGIGKAEFIIREVLNDAPGAGRAAGFAPRVYIARKFIADTGLTQYGAQVFHRIFVELKPGVTPEDVKLTYSDPDIFVRTPDDSTRGFERFFSFFNLYLVAITMIVFALSWVSAFYILQIFLQERLKNAAVFMINGGSRLAAALLYALQVFLVMALAFVAAGLVVEVVAYLANLIFVSQFPEGFTLRVAWRDWASLAAVATVSAFAFNAPFFVRLRFMKMQTLLGENALGIERLPRMTALVSYAPLLVVFLGLATWLMDSLRDALRLGGGMAGAALVGWFAGRVLFKAFFQSVKSTPGYTRLVATSLSRSRFGVNLCFLALVLVGLSLNLVPHLLQSVVEEIRPLEGKEVPSLFLFNIPESSLEEVKTFANSQTIELRYLSPLILGRLLKVNGEPTKNDQLQRFPVRLSSRPERIPSETLVEGTELPKTFDPTGEAVPEVSIEMRFAERNGFKLGDVLEFDIQSVPVQAKVTSIRRVKWTTFNPNFFIMFQPGVLDDAPKTYIANVNMAGGDAQKVGIQYELTKRFPDISVIDIGRTISRVLEIARSVIGPVTAAAWIAVVMSFLILLGVISHNLKLRDAEVDIEKLLGADAPLIRRLIVGEYAVTAIFAWFVGAGSALALAWAVTFQALEIPLNVSWIAIIGSLALTVLATMLVAYISCTRVLHLRGTSRKL